MYIWRWEEVNTGASILHNLKSTREMISERELFTSLSIEKSAVGRATRGPYVVNNSGYAVHILEKPFCDSQYTYM